MKKFTFIMIVVSILLALSGILNMSSATQTLPFSLGSSKIISDDLWENIGFYGRYGILAIEPDTGILYQCSSFGVFSIYQSTPWAESWSPLPSSLPFTCIDVYYDFSRDKLYISTATDIRVSQDGGETWQVLYLINYAVTGHVNNIYLLEGSSPILFGATEKGITLRSNDQGQTWSWVTYNLLDGTTTDNLETSITRIAFDPIHEGVVYLAAGSDNDSYSKVRGIYKSTDWGNTFIQIVREQDTTVMLTCGVGVSPGGTIYASYEGSGWRSYDSGVTWDQVPHPLGWGSEIGFHPSNPSIVYIWGMRSFDEGETWEGYGPFPPPLFVPGDPTIVFAESSYGVLKSVDGGETWLNASIGIAEQTVFNVAIDPHDSRRIFAQGIGGMGYTDDGGSTWDFPRVESVEGGIVIHPLDPQIIFAVIVNNIKKSYDGGSTWIPSTNVANYPIAYVGIQGLVFDPENLEQMFAAVTDYRGNGYDSMYTMGGVYKSTDGGLSWGSTALIDLPAWTVMTVSGTNRIYAGIANTYADSTLGGVRLSQDGGATWIRTGLDGISVSELLADPRYPDHLYAVTKHYYLGGIYKTTDGGLSWQKKTPDNMNGFWGLTYDPENPDHLYTIINSDIYRSVDAGQTWSLYRAYSLLDGRVQNITVLWKSPEPLLEFTGDVEGDEQVWLSWTYPDDMDVTGVRIQVSTDKNPDHYYEGELLASIERNGLASDTYLHASIDPGTTLYYSAFCIDTDNHYSLPSFFSLNLSERQVQPSLSKTAINLFSQDQARLYLGTTRGLFKTTLRPIIELYLPVVFTIQE